MYFRPKSICLNGLVSFIFNSCGIPNAVLLLFRAVGDQLLSIRHNITKHLYCLSSNTFMCAYNLNISVLFILSAFACPVATVVITNSAAQIVKCRRRAIRGCGSLKRLERSIPVKYRFIGCSPVTSQLPTPHSLDTLRHEYQAAGCRLLGLSCGLSWPCILGTQLSASPWTLARRFSIGNKSS